MQIAQVPDGTHVLSGMSTLLPSRQALFLMVNVDPNQDRQLLQVDYQATPPVVHTPLPVDAGHSGVVVNLASDAATVFVWMASGDGATTGAVAPMPTTVAQTAAAAQVGLGRLDIASGRVTPVGAAPYTNLTGGDAFAVSAGMASPPSRDCPHSCCV